MVKFHGRESATVRPMRFNLVSGWASAYLVSALISAASHAGEPREEPATSDTNSAGESNASDEAKDASSKTEPNTAPAAEDATKKPGEQDRTFPHAGQFSLRVGFVGAYRVVSRYDTSPYCENRAASTGEPIKLCHFGAPPALDVAIGFAPLNAIEPFAWVRFGLTGESSTNTQPLVALGVGARLYTLNDSAFKFFLQPAIGWELEKGAGNANWRGTEYKQDFLMQLLAGPQYDFSPGVGAYGAVGLTAGILRAIQTWMEFDIGIQARFP